MTKKKFSYPTKNRPFIFKIEGAENGKENLYEKITIFYLLARDLFHLVHLAHTAFSFINYFIDFITCEIGLRKIAQGSKFEKSGHLQNFKITFIESVLLYR